jgi:hypothetical protein
MPTRLALAATGFEAGLSYGHALQAPGKRELSASRLMHFQTRILGPYKAGAALPEMFALATEVVAARRARGERRAVLLTSAALVANGGAFAIWASGDPADQQAPEDLDGGDR